MIANEDYIKWRKNQSAKKWGENITNAQMCEFYKGQFLAFREILDPEHYGRDVKEVEKKNE